MVALPQNMVDGVSRFVLLALPFFILTGFVMESGGISRRLVMFVASLVGRLRGGLLQVTVVSMYIVSGISGSKAADVAAVGLVMRDMLEKEGYETAEAAAALAASAAMGECVPPSIAMLVLGSVTSLSVGALFAAGLIPAAVIALCLMVLIYVRALRRERAPGGHRRCAATCGWRSTQCIPASMPVFLFAGIFTGFATPTEMSAFAVAYGLLIACSCIANCAAQPGADHRHLVPRSRRWCCSPWRRRRGSPGCWRRRKYRRCWPPGRRIARQARCSW